MFEQNPANLDTIPFITYDVSMLSVFSAIPVRIKYVSGNLIHAQIQMHGKDLFSGIFHITSETGELVFLISQGKLVSIYKLVEKRWISLPKMEWDETITACTGELRITNFSIESLRLLRLFLEADFSESKTVPSIPAKDLTFRANQRRDGGRAIVETIRRDNAGALLLYPASESAFTEAVLVSDIQVQVGPAVANQIKSWGAQLCQVDTCVSDDRSEAWREYFLRISFSQFVQYVLQRYAELAGQFLIKDLNDQVNDEAKSWGMDLSLYGHNLSNRQFFETSDRAGRAYVTIFNVINEHMYGVIGEKVVMSIRKDAIMHLDLDARILVQEFVLSRLDQGIQEDR